MLKCQTKTIDQKPSTFFTEITAEFRFQKKSGKEAGLTGGKRLREKLKEPSLDSMLIQ